MDNPYQPPVLNPLGAGPGGGNMISEGVVRALSGTKPWVRLCSIIGFILTGLILVGALFMLLGAGFIGTFISQGGNSSPLVGAPFAVMAVLYVLFGILYLFPSIKLWKYGTHIANLMSSRSMADLEAALDAQRSFWKFIGILIAIFIGIYLVAIAVFVIAALAAGTMSR